MSETAQHEKTGCPIGPVELVSAHIRAIRLIEEAKLSTVTCNPVWEKLYRVKQYLTRQAEIELKDVLS